MSRPDDDARLTTLTISPSATGGGAEKVALTLHEAYLERGIDSWLALGNRDAEIPNSLQIPNDSRRSAWARALLRSARELQARSRRATDAAGLASRILRVAAEPARYARVGKGHEDFAFPETPHLLELPPRRPDIAHLHNLHGSYFDIRALPAISSQVPTMLTLHDAWLLTGHCAYPLDCERWRTGCGDCPRLGVYVPLRADASADNWQVKRDAVRASRVAIAAPSRWLLDMVEASQLMHAGVDTRVVPNGVDTRVFAPGDRNAARAELGLPQDAAVALFAAKGLASSAFKGFGTLTQALEVLGGRALGRRAVFVALGEEEPARHFGDVEVVFPAFETDPARVALYYRAADVYVHPARAENLPLAIIEAMACGIPVIASNVGGIPELVRPGQTGLLVAPDDALALAAAIEDLLGDEERRLRMGAAAVDRVREHFTLERQVDTYLAWYQELLAAR
jgi:glycosyltransferase involved in cell wall biosynthesis